MALKQATRLLNLKTPLGDDVLLLTGFDGHEGISQLFRFELSMISDNASIGAKDIVGKNVTFSIRLQDDSLRHFNGIVTRFYAGDEDENGRRGYRAEVVPNFWLLTRNADCRIFEKKTLKQIIEEVFKDRGLTDYKINFKGAHATREYCVQYRETDFHFLSRLMEEEGVWYAFKHEDGKHTMLIGDRNSAYFDCEQKEVDYPFDFGSVAFEDHIRSWQHRYEFRSGKVAQSDYNFETPSTELGTDSTSIIKDVSGASKYELYDYPGYYYEKGDGKPLADLRMEDEEVEHDVVAGTSLCRCFTPGGKFKIRQHRAATEKGKSFVITTISHAAREILGYESGGSLGTGYENSFTCIPDGVNFRPQRTTHKPSVQGLQTAVVIGDDEIPVDKYGRVRVRFPWDRKGKKENTGTCWVRVSQLWASKEWGGMHIPHKDDEVLVDFLDGDPDRPMIVGRVYNGERKVPLPLPADKTKSIIRDYGDNQMIWEGKPGEQYIQINQACGNGLIMNGEPGAESIQIRDMYGNQLFLGAASKTISLVSPSHQSGIVLGKSLHKFTGSNLVEVTGGWSAGAFIGNKFAADIGSKAGVTMGLASDLTVGMKCTAAFGHTIEYSKGAKITVGSQSGYSKMSKTSHTAAKEDCIVDADRSVWLLGGKNDQSVLEASADKLRLSFKTDAKNRNSVLDPGFKGVLPAVLAQGVTVAGVASQFIVTHVAGYDPPQIVTDKAFDKEDYYNAGIETLASGVAGAVGAAVVWANASYLAAKLKGAVEANRQGIASHDAPEAELDLTAGGVSIQADDKKQLVLLVKDDGITIASKDKRVEVTAQTDIDLAAKTGVITFSASESHFKKGSITHKNLTVSP